MTFATTSLAFGSLAKEVTFTMESETLKLSAVSTRMIARSTSSPSPRTPAVMFARLRSVVMFTISRRNVTFTPYTSPTTTSSRPATSPLERRRGRA